MKTLNKNALQQTKARKIKSQQKTTEKHKTEHKKSVMWQRHPGSREQQTRDCRCGCTALQQAGRLEFAARKQTRMLHRLRVGSFLCLRLGFQLVP